MIITVKLVGIFQIDRFKEEVRKYPTGICVQEVVDDLQIAAPLLGTALINDRHAGKDNVLKDGDTLCLLPFLDGG